MKKTRKFLSILLVLMLSICTFSGCSELISKNDNAATSNGQNTPESVAKEFMDAWAAGDGEKAASLCTEVDIDGYDDLKESAKEVADMCENMVYKITDVTETGNNAVVKVDITDRGKTWKDKTLYLTKENGTWKINGYSV